MVRAVNFDYKFEFMTVEIHDIASDWSLSIEFHWMISEKAIPQTAFLRCHVFA